MTSESERFTAIFAHDLLILTADHQRGSGRFHHIYINIYIYIYIEREEHSRLPGAQSPGSRRVLLFWRWAPQQKLSAHCVMMVELWRAGRSSVHEENRNLRTRSEEPAWLLETRNQPHYWRPGTSLTTGEQEPASWGTSLTTGDQEPAWLLETRNQPDYWRPGTSLTTGEQEPASLLEMRNQPPYWRRGTSLPTGDEEPAYLLEMRASLVTTGVEQTYVHRAQRLSRFLTWYLTGWRSSPQLLLVGHLQPTWLATRSDNVTPAQIRLRLSESLFSTEHLFSKRWFGRSEDSQMQ